jgi:hypothetical protein
MLCLTNAAEPDWPGRQSQGQGRRGNARRPSPIFGKMISGADIEAMAPMAANLDDDVRSLSEWVHRAWRLLADPSLTSFDRRETRNYMKQAEAALRAGLKRIAELEKTRREADRVAFNGQRLDFRILKLDT